MNRTSKCLPPHLLRYSFLQEYSKNIFVVVCVLDVIVFVSASVGNLLILLGLRRSHYLHPPSEALFSSLALSDLAVGLFVVPLHFGLMLAIVIENPSFYCKLFSPVTVLAFILTSVSALTTTAIAVDRYLAFRLKLRYRYSVNVKRVVVVIASQWIIAIAWAGLWVADRKANNIVGGIGMCLCVLTNFYCYLKISLGLRKHRTVRVHDELKQSGTTHPMKYFNVVVYRRLTKNMFIIYCIILFCYVPYLMAMVFLFVFGVNSNTFFILSVSYIIILLNSSLNPVVYFWRIPEIRQQVLDLFHSIYLHLTS